MTEMKEKLNQKTDELDRILLAQKNNDKIDQNYERQLEINRKELNFLRDELQLARSQIAELQEQKVNEQELKQKEVSFKYFLS